MNGHYFLIEACWNSLVLDVTDSLAEQLCTELIYSDFSFLWIMFLSTCTMISSGMFFLCLSENGSGAVSNKVLLILM